MSLIMALIKRVDSEIAANWTRVLLFGIPSGCKRIRSTVDAYLVCTNSRLVYWYIWLCGVAHDPPWNAHWICISASHPRSVREKIRNDSDTRTRKIGAALMHVLHGIIRCILGLFCVHYDNDVYSNLCFFRSPFFLLLLSIYWFIWLSCRISQNAFFPLIEMCSMHTRWHWV